MMTFGDMIILLSFIAFLTASAYVAYDALVDNLTKSDVSCDPMVYNNTYYVVSESPAVPALYEFWDGGCNQVMWGDGTKSYVCDGDALK